MKSLIDDPLFLTKLSARVLGGRAFQIKTQPCVRFFANLQRWLTTGMLGAIVYGRPRLGKTSASRWVLNAMRIKLGNVPWIEIPVRKQHLTSERAFFQHILHCASSKYYNKGSAADRRDRLKEALIMRARRSPLRAVILFFDEAQLLDETHYFWLMNISNELELHGFRVFCLLVGQHQLFHRRETFLSEGLEEIVGRFMTEAWAFPGIESFKEFEDCLIEFDDVVYPENSGLVFVAQFVPLAHQAGWRLKQVAPALWERFFQQCGGGGNDGRVIIPMHYFCSAVTNLLDQISRIDTENIEINVNVIEAAVDRSGFKNAIFALKR